MNLFKIEKRKHFLLNCKKRCDKCKRGSTRKSRVRLERLPKILAIQLKRWLSDQVDTRKSDIAVYFDSTRLDLSEFVHSNSLCTRLKQSYVYELYAFIVHLGQQSNLGHYTVYCKNPYTLVWHHFDDQK